LLASSLTLVIAQRLVRRICNDCREEYEPGGEVRTRAGMPGDKSIVFRGRGCTACGGTGYSGRIGIYELYRPTNAIRKLINDRATEADLRFAARQGGMVPLRDDAVTKIKAGITSPDEVLRVVQVDENELPCPGCKALIEATFASCRTAGGASRRPARAAASRFASTGSCARTATRTRWRSRRRKTGMPTAP